MVGAECAYLYVAAAMTIQRVADALSMAIWFRSKPDALLQSEKKVRVRAKKVPPD